MFLGDRGNRLSKSIRLIEMPNSLPVPTRIHLGEMTARQMLRTAGDAIVAVDAQFRVVCFNDAAERLFGYTERQILGRSVDLLIPEEHRGVHMARAQGLTGGDRFHGSGRMRAMEGRRADGRRFRAAVSLSRSGSAEGEVVMAVLREFSQWESSGLPGQGRSLAEHLPPLVWAAGPDGRFDDIGPQWQTYTGVPREIQLGLGWVVQVHPDDCQRVIEAWRGRHAADRGFQCDLRIRRRDGLYRWFRMQATPVRAESGALRRWIGACTDVDDLLRQGARSSAEGERLALAVEAGEVGIWDLEPATGIWTRNAVHDRLFGYPGPEPTWDFALAERHMLPADRASFRRAWDSAADIGIVDAEARVRHPDGALRWIAARGQRVDEAGRLVGTVIDITDRKEAEAAKAWMDAMVDSMQDGVITLTQDGVITSWNEGARRLLGWRADEVTGRHVSLIVPDDLAEDAAARLNQEATGLCGPACETRRRHKDGRQIELSIMMSPIRDPLGRLIGLSAVFRDIRGRKAPAGLA